MICSCGKVLIIRNKGFWTFSLWKVGSFMCHHPRRCHFVAGFWPKLVILMHIFLGGWFYWSVIMILLIIHWTNTLDFLLRSSRSQSLLKFMVLLLTNVFKSIVFFLRIDSADNVNNQSGRTLFGDGEMNWRMSYSRSGISIWQLGLILTWKQLNNWISNLNHSDLNEIVVKHYNIMSKAKFFE